jgi:hypothetical protein
LGTCNPFEIERNAIQTPWAPFGNMVNTFGEYQSPKKSKLFGNKNLNHPNNKHTLALV